MLGWVVRGVWDNTVCEGWVPVYGGYPFCWGLANSNVQRSIWLSDSGSVVNFMFGWSVLKSFCMFLMSVWRDNYQNVIIIAMLMTF